MRVLAAVLIFFLCGCAPLDDIRHGHVPDKGCLFLPKGKLPHNDPSGWEVRVYLRCSLGSGVEEQK